MGASNECQHGQLERSCELCEKDAEISCLKDIVDALKGEVKRLKTPPGAVRGEVNMLSFDDFRDHPRGGVTVYKKGRLGVVNVQPVEVRPLSKGE